MVGTFCALCYLQSNRLSFLVFHKMLKSRTSSGLGKLGCSLASEFIVPTIESFLFRPLKCFSLLFTQNQVPQLKRLEYDILVNIFWLISGFARKKQQYTKFLSSFNGRTHNGLSKTHFYICENWKHQWLFWKYFFVEGELAWPPDCQFQKLFMSS